MRTIFIAVIIIAFVILGGLYLCYSFIKSFTPPTVTVTTSYIETNRDFINGITIEKIIVDSIGKEGYPLIYSTVYSTSCNIDHPKNKPPDPPSKIDFYEPGKYSWDEDTVLVRHRHDGLRRKSQSSSNKLWWLNKFGKHPICPLTFETNTWYFINISDPRVTGIFYYIDNSGKDHQYFLESGASPI